jgi:hypothetical protein
MRSIQTHCLNTQLESARLKEACRDCDAGKQLKRVVLITEKDCGPRCPELASAVLIVGCSCYPRNELALTQLSRYPERTRAHIRRGILQSALCYEHWINAMQGTGDEPEQTFGCTR